MHIINHHCLKLVICSCAILFFLEACDQSSQKKKTDKNIQPENSSVIKPPTVFPDTLIISTKAAIFFYPDSQQLQKMRTATDTAKFDAMMHEYEYQFRYIHSVLNKYWRNIKIIEAKNSRYLVFIKSDKSKQITDLDKINDLYGFLVFDPEAGPAQLEMTNAESEIGFYFLPKGPLKTK